MVSDPWHCWCLRLHVHFFWTVFSSILAFYRLDASRNSIYCCSVVTVRLVFLGGQTCSWLQNLYFGGRKKQNYPCSTLWSPRNQNASKNNRAHDKVDNLMGHKILSPVMMVKIKAIWNTFDGLGCHDLGQWLKKKVSLDVYTSKV